MKEDLPSPEVDVDDEGFLQAPAIALTTDDDLVVLEEESYVAFTYTRCDYCIFATKGCTFWREHGTCQLERNLFRQQLQDLQSQGIGIRDKGLILAGFIALKGMWRQAAKLAIFDEKAEYEGSKEAVQLLKSNHKSVVDYTKEYIRVQKELLTTPKERKTIKGKPSQVDSFSIFLAKKREEMEEED